MTQTSADQRDSDINPAPAALGPPPVARLQRRHYGILWAFVIIVILPVFVSAFYLYAIAHDQFVSTAGFAIRHAQSPGSGRADLGGLALITGNAADDNGELLYDFLQSQTLIERVNARFDLIDYYAQHWPKDPLYSLWPTASIEQLVWFWQHVIGLSYDHRNRLFRLNIRAFDAQSAQKIAQLILDESQAMIDTLNAAERRDATMLSKAELSHAAARLRDAQAELTRFRAQTQILDPQSDLASRSGVLGSLQQQLAQALIDRSLLAETTDNTDVRRLQLERRIKSIRAQIQTERDSLSAPFQSLPNHQKTGEAPRTDTSYPQMLARYEGLQLNLSFAQDNYIAALNAQDEARQGAERKTLYLAIYEPPTLAQTAQQPARLSFLGMIAGFSILIWGVLCLIYYSLRDRG